MSQPQVKQQSESALQWEYQVILEYVKWESAEPQHNLTKRLKQYGEAGWELVSTTVVTKNESAVELLMILKRPQGTGPHPEMD